MRNPKYNKGAAIALSPSACVNLTECTSCCQTPTDEVDNDLVLVAVVGEMHLLLLPSNKRYHAGLAFSDEERERLYLRGLLPPAVLSQEVQAERVMINIRSKQCSSMRNMQTPAIMAL